MKTIKDFIEKHSITPTKFFWGFFIFFLFLCDFFVLYNLFFLGGNNFDVTPAEGFLYSTIFAFVLEGLPCFFSGALAKLMDKEMMRNKIKNVVKKKNKEDNISNVYAEVSGKSDNENVDSDETDIDEQLKKKKRKLSFEKKKAILVMVFSFVTLIAAFVLNVMLRTIDIEQQTIKFNAQNSAYESGEIVEYDENGEEQDFSYLQNVSEEDKDKIHYDGYSIDSFLKWEPIMSSITALCVSFWFLTDDERTKMKKRVDLAAKNMRREKQILGIYDNLFSTLKTRLWEKVTGKHSGTKETDPNSEPIPQAWDRYEMQIIQKIQDRGREDCMQELPRLLKIYNSRVRSHLLTYLITMSQYSSVPDLILRISIDDLIEKHDAASKTTEDKWSYEAVHDAFEAELWDLLISRPVKIPNGGTPVGTRDYGKTDDEPQRYYTGPIPEPTDGPKYPNPEPIRTAENDPPKENPFASHRKKNRRDRDS